MSMPTRDTERNIDGSYGEGGGQLLRTAVSLAAATGFAVRIHSIRARREPPGLAPQHLAAVRAACEMCHGHVEGDLLRSQEITFAPGRMEGGEYTFDIGTAGSITLLLQALLPMMVAAQKPFRVEVIGGTDVRAAPPFDYFRNVLMPLLASVGVNATLTLLQRGYYPRGGGVVEAAVSPGRLRAMTLENPGALLEVGGIAHVAHLSTEIAGRMRTSALASLGDLNVPEECVILDRERALGRGGAVVLWARCEQSVLGAGRAAERGTRAEVLGSDTGAALRAEVMAHTALDVHAADQILVYLALTDGTSYFTTREATEHALTAMWLIEQFLPVRFSVEPVDGRVRIRVSRQSTSTAEIERDPRKRIVPSRIESAPRSV